MKFKSAKPLLLLTALVLGGLSAYGQAQSPSQNYPFYPNKESSGADPETTPATTSQMGNTTATIDRENRTTEPRRERTPSREVSTDRSQTVFDSNLYRVTKRHMSGDIVGQEFTYRIRVEAKEPIANIEVWEELPGNVSFVSANPSASNQDGRLYWAWDRMSAGETRDILVTVNPNQEGQFTTCTVVSVDPMVCLPMYAGQPLLAITKTGPQRLELNSTGDYVLTVTNEGSGVARNVNVRDEAPAGMSLVSSGQQTIPALTPGESRSFDVTLRADETGEFVNTAVATFDGGEPVRADLPIEVVQSSIAVTKSGPDRSFVFKETEYNMTVTNDGDTTLRNVEVIDTVPDDLQIVSMGGGEELRGNRIRWEIPSLAPQQSRSYNISVLSNEPMTATNTVTASTDALEDSAEATTVFTGVPGILISLVDTNDPVKVGNSTTYRIEIRNQGDFEPVNSTVRLLLSDNVTPLAEGGDFNGTINGQEVTFPSVLLEPGKSIDLRVRARAVKPGIARARAEFSAEFLPEPFLSEEPTNIY